MHLPRTRNWPSHFGNAVLADARKTETSLCRVADADLMTRSRLDACTLARASRRVSSAELRTVQLLDTTLKAAISPANGGRRRTDNVVDHGEAGRDRTGRISTTSSLESFSSISLHICANLNGNGNRCSRSVRRVLGGDAVKGGEM